MNKKDAVSGQVTVAVAVAENAGEGKASQQKALVSRAGKPSGKQTGKKVLEEILGSSEPLIYHIDYRKGAYEYASAAVARLFAVDYEEFLDRGVEIMRASMNPQDYRQTMDRFRALCRENPGQAVRTEANYALQMADGRVHHFIDHVTLESDSAGDLMASYGVATDVSAHVAVEHALRDSEERFLELLGSLEEMIWCYSADLHTVLYVNDAVERIYGRPREDFLQNPRLWKLAIHPDDRETAHLADLRVLEEGKAYCDCRIFNAEGEERWLRFSLYRVNREHERRVVGIGVDVTDRKRAELALAESEELFHTTMGAAQIGIFVVQNGVLAYVNPLLPRLFGYTEQEMLGMSPLDLTASEMRSAVADQMRRRMNGEGGQPFESLALRKNGSTFPVMVLAAPANYKGMPASVGTVFDLSERKEAEKQILELAFFDPLTGLPNRRLLEDRFGQALAEAERSHGKLAVFFLDLDNFKRVNDSLGHSVGDELLCAVSERIRGMLRKFDTVARLGGDEFIMLLPYMGMEDAAEVARRLMALCSEPFMIGRHALGVTPSVGISLYPDDGRDFESLMKNADTAMYQAKEAGRANFQFFAKSMNVATLERLLLENSMRQALAAGQFHLVYQPLVELKNCRIIGCEALLRWRHPEIGPVSPARFIPVAEDTGLINAIGDWVLHTACRQAREWQERGLPPVKMAVNVSPVQFKQSSFVDMVAGVLATSGLEAHRLELEMTERTVMSDAEANIATLESLARMSVELAVDDFGTGYSSLAYLKRFPVGKLKIDQSFVQGIDSDPDDLAIATTIVNMGHSLRLNVLAEGVEKAEQLAVLRQIGCDLAQGYYFSPPVTADVFADLLRRQPFLEQ